MWSTEHSRETIASPESIWRLWSDVTTWPEWNADIERIEITGPFAAGSTISMTPIGQDTVELRIAEAAEPDLFIDEGDLGDVLVRTIHRIDRLDDERNRVTYRMEISGPRGRHDRAEARSRDQRRLPRDARRPGREAAADRPR